MKRSSGQSSRTRNGTKSTTLSTDRFARHFFAVDELCGFIIAVAYVRPEKLVGMTPKSVRKKMKAKGFAAAVKREDIVYGAELMETELNDHIAEVIAALQGASSALGFA